MVVSDLHGDWPLYSRYRDVFLNLRAHNLASTLIICGDFIHSNAPPEDDGSLKIVRDLLALRSELGSDLVVLLGNHEMPHLYHVTLARGEHLYTPRFEAAMGAQRDAILDFFDSLPFFARTPAGVSICHAGAFAAAHNPAAMQQLLTLSHQAVINEITERLPLERRAELRAKVGKLCGQPYRELAQQYLAVSDPHDTHYDDYLIGFFTGEHTAFKLLWEALFSRNENAGGMDNYTRQVRALLAHLSRGYARQSVLVSGHIGCRHGYRVLAKGQQLRIASGAHAYPYAEARYLLFDTAKSITQAKELHAGLGCVFAT